MEKIILFLIGATAVFCVFRLMWKEAKVRYSAIAHRAVVIVKTAAGNLVEKSCLTHKL